MSENKSSAELQQQVTTLEKQIEGLTHQIKQLRCLNRICRLNETCDTEQDLIRTAVDLIPAGCRYPEMTCARIILNDHDAATPHFKDTVRHNRFDLIVDPQPRGHLVLGYFEDLSGDRAVLALREDQALLKEISSRLSGMIGQKQARLMMEEKINLFHRIIENMPIMLDAFDEDGNIVLWNHECENVSGYHACEIIGNPKALDLIYPDPTLRKLRTAMISKCNTDFRNREWKARCRDGSFKTIALSNISSKFPIPGWMSWFIGMDITPIRQAQKALKYSEEKFRAIFEQSPIGISLTDSNFNLIDTNRSALEIFGISDMSSINKMNFSKDPNASDNVMEQLKSSKTVQYEITYDFEKIKQKNFYKTEKSGTIFLYMNVTRLGGEGSKLFNGIMIQYQDITRHKQAEQQIHELTQRLITAQENERQRISRYLHDRVAQDLSSIKIGCETIFDQDTHVPDSIRHHIFHWSGILKDTISVVRDMSYDLHPAGLEQLGLIQTLSNNCEGFTDKTGIPVEFLTAGLDDIDLNFDTQINLFRVIQEALNNIASHAQASHVMIKLVRSYPHIMLRIEDNGKGFDINRQTLSSLATKHIGIQSMKERIRLLNGSFEIQSQPMKGTKIHIKIPFMDEEA